MLQLVYEIDLFLILYVPGNIVFFYCGHPQVYISKLDKGPHKFN